MSTNLGHLEATLGLNTTGFMAGLAQAQSAMKAASASMIKAGKAMTMAISLPLAILGGAAVNTFANFEKAMNQVRAVTQATGKDFADLEDLARELGSTTKFTAVEAAEGMGFLAMAGFEVNEVLAAMPATLNLAAAGVMELSRAADIVSNVMQGFGIEASRTEEVADIMTATFTNANASLEQIGESMAYVAPVAKAFGQTIATASAAVGFLGNAGIQGSRAGTALRQMFLQLDKKAGELGISVRDAAGNFLDLADVLANVEKAGLRTDKVISILGPRAGVGMAALMDQGSEALRNFSDEVANAGGIAERVANTQLEGLAGAFTELKSALAEVAISFGEVVGPMLESFVDSIKGVILGWGKLDTHTKKIIITIMGLAAAIGPVIFIVGKLLALFVLIATPVGLAVTGVVLLTGAFAGLSIAMGKVDTKRLSKEYDDLKDSVENLESSFPALLKEYEDLSSKADRSETENARLKTVMKDIADIVPTAVTAWNDHGEALGINVTAANDFMKVQQAMLKLKNAEEIERQTTAMTEYEKSVERLTQKLNLSAKASGGGAPKAFALGKEELERVKGSIQEYNAQIAQTKLRLAGLTGEYEKYGIILDGLPPPPPPPPPPGTEVAKGYEGLADQIIFAKESQYAFMQSLQDTIDLMKGEGIKFMEEYTTRATTAYEKLQAVINAPMVANPFTEMKEEVAELAPGVEDLQVKLQGVQDSSDALGVAVQNALNSAFVELGETLGGIFTGDAGAATFFEGILLILASFMKTLGQAAIAAGTVGIAFQNLISNPYLLVAAGIALVAAATIVGNIMKKGPKGEGSPQGLASGGFVTSGGVFQLHKDELVSLPNGSAVTPANMAGGGVQTINVRGYIAGGAIRWMLDEEDRKIENTF